MEKALIILLKAGILDLHYRILHLSPQGNKHFKEPLDIKNALDKYNGHPSNKWISFLLLTKTSTARNLDFMCPYTNSSRVCFFLLLTCSQRKAISLSSSSDFRKSKHPIARGGFTLPLITETLLWNTICFQKSREVKDKKKWQLLKACEELGDWYSLASELGQENTLVKMLPRIML